MLKHYFFVLLTLLISTNANANPSSYIGSIELSDGTVLNAGRFIDFLDEESHFIWYHEVKGNLGKELHHGPLFGPAQFNGVVEKDGLTCVRLKMLDAAQLETDTISEEFVKNFYRDNLLKPGNEVYVDAESFRRVINSEEGKTVFDDFVDASDKMVSRIAQIVSGIFC